MLGMAICRRGTNLERQGGAIQRLLSTKTTNDEMKVCCWEDSCLTTAWQEQLP